MDTAAANEVIGYRKNADHERIVIALGGNSLGMSADEESAAIDTAVPFLLDLATHGNEIIITHGNGPQVGMFQNAMRIAHDHIEAIPEIDLSDAVAITQGFIGYHLQQELSNEIIRRKLPWQVATVITRIEVNKDDPAFKDPVKPIGRFLSPEEIAEERADEPDARFMEDSGRGCRRAVASPVPLRIVEAPSILNLIDNDFIAIACGGGGIPVTREIDGTYRSISGVLDKDLASALLANDCGAEVLLLLTGVDHVALDYNKMSQIDLAQLSVEDADYYMAQGQFGKGSMEPKVRAALEFVRNYPDRLCIIASLEKAADALAGRSGTRFSDAYTETLDVQGRPIMLD